MISGGQTVLIRRARLSDLAPIMAIEQASFPTPWAENDLRMELAGLARGTYLAAEVAGEVVGYIGMWFYAGEAHIGTLAVAPEQRGQGLGEALLLALLEHVAQRGGTLVTLEYRINNLPAEGLYRKYGFIQTRIRKGYYEDTHEDGVEVILRDVGTPTWHEQMKYLRQEWGRKHGAELRSEI